MKCLGNNFFKALRGKMGNIVFFTRWGQIYARKLSDSKKNPQSELQQLQRRRMSVVVAFYRIVSATFLISAWREAAKGESFSGMNLFVKKNIMAFDSDGRATDYVRLHFAIGSLPVCDCLKASYDSSKEEVRLNWKNRARLSVLRMSDQMAAVVLYENDEFTVFAPHIQSSRDGCVALLPLSKIENRPIWVYCFFVSVMGTLFSDDINLPLNG